MKILHVVDQINQEKHGGSATVPFQLARAQAKLGQDVTIWASDYEAKEQAAPEGVRLVKFKTFYSYQSLRLTPGMFYAPWAYHDIVHFHNYRVLTHLMVATNFECPMILQAHGNAAPIAGRWRYLAYPLWRFGVRRKCARFIADADLEIDHYLKEGARLSQIVKIPVGLNTDEFMATRHERNGHRTILYLGRLAEIKGVDVLLKAFKLLDWDDARLVIAGPDHGSGDALRILAYELGIQHKVDFLGMVKGADKARLYANADVYVLPSRYEMWGLTFMEALASGTPVILSDKCAAASELPEECGSVSTLHELDLAGKLGDMLRSDFASQYREFRKAWVAKYDWKNIALQTLALYREVITERCHSR